MLALPPHQGPSRSCGGAAETRRLHDCQHGIHMSINSLDVLPQSAGRLSFFSGLSTFRTTSSIL
eukprot:scaffold37804_cov62-Attheya_sp.AAC.4